MVRFSDTMGGAVWVNRADVIAVCDAYEAHPAHAQRHGGAEAARVLGRPRRLATSIIFRNGANVLVEEAPDTVARLLFGSAATAAPHDGGGARDDRDDADAPEGRPDA
jgi:hypothetical protein